jgi:hypothetical protein
MPPLDISAFFASVTLFGLAGYLEQLAKSRVERPGPELANLLFTICGKFGALATIALAVYAFFLFHWISALLIVIGSFVVGLGLEKFISSTVRPGVTLLSFVGGTTLLAFAISFR